jgi:hypothetical protein
MRLHQCIALLLWTIQSTSPVLAQTSEAPSAAPASTTETSEAPSAAPASTTETSEAPSAAPASTTECVNDLVFRLNGNSKKDCFWLMEPAKERRREKLCKRKGVKDACPNACGLCSCVAPAECGSDLVFRVGGKNKKDCDWVNKPKKVKRREKLCKKQNVRAACPDVCGLCCLD